MSERYENPPAAALEYLRHALRDLDRAAEQLSGVAGAEAETRATKQAADLVDDLVRAALRFVQ